MKETLLRTILEIKKFCKNTMKEKKQYTPPRTDNEQKGMHTKVLIGATIVTLIIVLITIYVG